MKYYFLNIISFVFFFCLTTNVSAQVKSMSKTATNPLERVRNVFENDPKLALRLLDEEIRIARKKNRTIALAESYVVLARVNEYLGDLKTAQENLNEANKYLISEKKNTKRKSKTSSSLAAEFSLVQGKISLGQEELKKAKTAFDKCIGVNTKGKVYLLCKEGQADVKAFEGNHTGASKMYEQLKLEKSQNNTDIARLESKLANSLASLGKIEEANAAYQNANVIEAKDSYDKNVEDYGAANNRSKYLDKARDNIVNKAKLEKLDPIDISVRNIEDMKEKDLPKLAIQREQIELSKLYLEEKLIVESEALLDEVLNAPAKNLSELNEAFEIKAKIGEEKKDYKQAYEYLKKRLDKDEGEKWDSKRDNILKEKSTIEKNLKDYKIQEKDSIIQKIRNRSTLILFGLLSLITLGSLVFSFFLWRNVLEKNRANKLLELKSLRTQMNPHFIFNSMNSINNYIAINDEKSANKYIADFSKLIRKIMDFSQREFISLEEEIELLEIYLRLEQMRFRDKFDYTFIVDEQLREDQKNIPPMLIQPLLENAVWHGLRYKDEKGHLHLAITQEGKNVIVKIEDDGIGRERSIELKTKNQKQYKSTGISNINKRLDLINKLYKKKFTLTTQDRNPKALDKGTSVIMNLDL